MFSQTRITLVVHTKSVPSPKSIKSSGSRNFCSTPPANPTPAELGFPPRVRNNDHPLENWKIHPYYTYEDYMTPEQVAKKREWDRTEGYKRFTKDLEPSELPPKFKAEPFRDVIVSDASFIFNKYIPNPGSKDFSHVRIKVPECTYKAIANSWDRIWLQPEEGIYAKNYFYMGFEPQCSYMKETEVGKIDPGMGAIMAIDASMVEQATDAQRKQWTLDKFMSLFPYKQIPKYRFPRFTWRQQGQKAIRSNFPFAAWTGEFNFLGSTESIAVYQWMLPKGPLSDVNETHPRALAFETVLKTKLMPIEDDPDFTKFWADVKQKHTLVDYPPYHIIGLPSPYMEKVKIRWDYVEGAPEQNPTYEKIMDGTYDKEWAQKAAASTPPPATPPPKS